MEITGVVLTDKACTKCGEVKPLEAFHKDRTTKDGHYPSCKECKKPHSALAYQIAKERMDDYIKSRGDRCEICHNRYPSEIYNFHHPEPSIKDQDLGVRMWAGTGTYLKTLKEADKCFLLCPTCHALEHYYWRQGMTLLADWSK